VVVVVVSRAVILVSFDMSRQVIIDKRFDRRVERVPESVIASSIARYGTHNGGLGLDESVLLLLRMLLLMMAAGGPARGTGR
jgi:hypothetical protein